jgi:cyclic beta-1,2-glucan synthetase
VILGFRFRAGKLLLTPNIPAEWPGFEIFFRHASARYEILVENPHRVGHGVARVELDGTELSTRHIALVDDGRAHQIRVTLGKPADVFDERAAQLDSGPGAAEMQSAPGSSTDLIGS